MNSSWLGHRIAFGLLGLLVALPALVTCSEHDASAPANAGGSPPNTAGAPSVAATSDVAGMGGASSIAGASASAAGAFGQGGFAASAGAGGANTGGVPGTGLGGSGGAASGGSAGPASPSAGQGGSGSSGSAGSSAAFARVSTILGKNCGLAGCHADRESPRLAPGALLYETLTGPNTVLAACDYTKLVEAGDPSQSALVRLMNRKCGTFTMPPSCNKTTCLSAADLTAISDWIQAGAPP